MYRYGSQQKTNWKRSTIAGTWKATFLRTLNWIRCLWIILEIVFLVSDIVMPFANNIRKNNTLSKKITSTYWYKNWVVLFFAIRFVKFGKEVHTIERFFFRFWKMSLAKFSIIFLLEYFDIRLSYILDK